MSDEKKEEKSLEQLLIERNEDHAITIAGLKGQLQQLDQIASELAKDASEETINRLGIKRPIESEEE